MKKIKLKSIILSLTLCVCMSIEKSLAQRVGIETTQPEASLHVDGEDGLLVTGELGVGADLETSGEGTRMFFYPKKAAFRVGRVTGNQWDDSLIGGYSSAWNYSSIASGFASTAWGINTVASGFYTSAWGGNTRAKSDYETVFGRYNTDYTPFANFGWSETDRLFGIGNGTSDTNRSDALVVLKNGRTGIGIANPEATLHVADEDGLLVTGEFGAGENLETSGPGTKMFFYPKKAAFRAGAVVTDVWDDGQIGDYSAAWGRNAAATGLISTAWGRNGVASGDNSTAWGRSAEASGLNSTAWGNNTVASGNSESTAWGNGTVASATMSTAWGTNTSANGLSSTAWGSNTEALNTYSTSWGLNTLASGYASTAWGNNTEASGNYSAASGGNVVAKSTYETVMGRYNTNYTPNSTTGWNTNDRLFGVGNGTSNTSRSDAMVILKNGKVGIGSSNPPHKLTINVPSSGSVPNGEGLGIVNLSTNDYWNIHVVSWLRFSFLNFEISYINPASGAYVSLSDRRLKENIRPLQSGTLEKVNKINTVHFNYKRDKQKTVITGVIAQELKELFPEFVSQENSDTYMGVDYAGLSVVAIKAIQEQQDEIELQKNEIKILKTQVVEIESLKAKNKALEEKIDLILQQLNK